MKKLFILITLALLISGCVEYSDGYRTGVVTKFSKKGIFCRSDSANYFVYKI